MKSHILYVLLFAMLIPICMAKTSTELHVLEIKVINGNVESFKTVLHISENMSPGENLERLFFIISQYVKINPESYLKETLKSKNTKKCLAVSFLGEKYIDDWDAKKEEYQKRIKALNSVTNIKYTSIKNICIRKIEKNLKIINEVIQ